MASSGVVVALQYAGAAGPLAGPAGPEDAAGSFSDDVRVAPVVEGGAAEEQEPANRPLHAAVQTVVAASSGGVGMAPSPVLEEQAGTGATMDKPVAVLGAGVVDEFVESGGELSSEGDVDSACGLDRMDGGMDTELGDESRPVLIMYTGGTIGMKKTARGYAPAPGFLQETLRGLQTLQDPTMPVGVTPLLQAGMRVRYNIIEYDPLVDSCNMTHKDWARIAMDIQKYYDDYDGFVILHGTDTMAYTASALSFMLQNLGKPVVLTGSQIPLSCVRNDAEANLLGALTIAGLYDVPEVCLFFAQKLLRGNRSTKHDASGLDAFRSFNYPPLATAGVDYSVMTELLLPIPTRALNVRPEFCENVIVLSLYPGMSLHLLQTAMASPVRGVVLRTYGAGNGPDRDAAFLSILTEASRRGVVIVNCTQCQCGTVTTEYATGMALQDAGVVPAGDMTVESALTKLGCLLGIYRDPQVVRDKFKTVQCGEMAVVSTAACLRRRVSARTKSSAHLTPRAQSSLSKQRYSTMQDIKLDTSKWSDRRARTKAASQLLGLDKELPPIPKPRALALACMDTRLLAAGAPMWFTLVRALQDTQRLAVA